MAWLTKLKEKKQGTYKVDESRSAIYLPLTKNFPKNTEFEATLTLTGEPEGDWIRSVTPTAKAVTVREHHSFVELPDDDYQPRVFDPRSGYYPMSYADYATPIAGAAGEALHHPASAAQKRSGRRHERAGRADHLLCRSRRAGADQVGADRGRLVVEPGLRSGRLQGCFPGEGVTGRSRPDGPALQRDRMGPPLHPRLVLWQLRSSIRGRARSSRAMSR